MNIANLASVFNHLSIQQAERTCQGLSQRRYIKDDPVMEITSAKEGQR
jgi:hypothetical protein